MAGHAAAPDQVSELATDKEHSDPAEVNETKGESGDTGETEAEEGADGEAEADVEENATAKRRMSEARLAIVAGLLTVVALAALTAWLDSMRGWGLAHILCAGRCAGADTRQAGGVHRRHRRRR